jgi:hypothetical protein
MKDDVESFKLANKAYGLMSTAEQMDVIQRFAKLQYPSAVDRFFEAVHQVVSRNDRQVQP